MRRLLLVMAVAAAALTIAVAPAYATAPHFISASATGPSANGSLTVNFKIAGLGNTVTTTVIAAARVTVTYACQNNGGNFPSDPKKHQTVGSVSASGQFTSGKNGQITGSLTLRPPASTLTCPPGQRLVLVNITYTNVVVSALGAGTQSIPGTFSRVFFTI